MRMNVEKFTLQDYLGQEFDCACGKLHSTNLEHVAIEENVKEDILAFLNSHHYETVFMVADENTYRVYGEALQAYLQSQGKTIDYVVLKADVVPNETAVFQMLCAMKQHYDYVLGVGSGTLNDLCKFLSKKVSLDYGIVATAPSMDGFASVGAALIIDDLKTTFDCHVPTAIFGDLDVLANAPLDMIKAGLGDIVGKYNCLVDWKIAHLINDEYYCPTIVAMVYKSINEVVANAKGVLTRDKTAVKAITEALILTGMAMGFVGNSRPASGSEHHVSHYWEMKFLFAHKAPVFHGTKVGLATPGVIALWKQLAKEDIDFEACKQQLTHFDKKRWEALVKDRFEGAAEGVLALEEKAGKNNIEQALQRITNTEAHWEEIKTVIENELPQPEEVSAILTSIEAAAKPSDVGISDDLAKDGVILAKEVRVRYGLLQLLWDLSRLDAYSDAFVAYYKG